MCPSNVYFSVSYFYVILRRMSGKRDDSFTLCRFTFADGRQCRSLAHAAFDDLCFQHGTFRPRASRKDNFLREIAPLATGSSQIGDCAHAHRALLRAVEEGRISADQFRVLQNISEISRWSKDLADEDDWACARGPAWNNIRKLIEEDVDPKSFASHTSPDPSNNYPDFIDFRERRRGRVSIIVN
jgi:hypothetical protein